MILRMLTLLLIPAWLEAQSLQQRLPSITCSASEYVKGDGSCGNPAGGSLPSGAIILIVSGSCPTGFTEEASLSGKFVLGTTTAAGGLGTTGGQDTVTTVLNHTHTVNVTDTGHNHTQNSFAPRIVNSGTAGTVGVQGASTASNANASNAATTATNQSATTGITATTANPAGGVASIDNRPAFVKVIFCKAN